MMIVILGLYSLNKSRVFKIHSYPFNAQEAISAIRESVWEIPLPFIIIVGIYGGIFTVAEAAVITVGYVTIISVWINNDLSLHSDIPRLMKESIILAGTIIIILGIAMGFTNYLVDQQIPMQVLGFTNQHIDNKITFLILLNIFLLTAGCLMDIFSAIIVIAPLVVPIAQSYEIDMVHLGIIFLTNLEIGYSTPPIGINLFIASSRFTEPVVTLYRAVLPFIGIRVIGLFLITYFPALSLYIPNLLLQ
jgi:C4-dicarboxylate transporter, DctM subunit